MRITLISFFDNSLPGAQKIAAGHGSPAVDAN